MVIIAGPCLGNVAACNYKVMGNSMKRFVLAAAMAAMAWPLHAAKVDVGPFVADGAFRQIKISPTGEYYAIGVPVEGQTGLMILRRADNKVTGALRFLNDTSVSDFWWVSDTRVLASIAESDGLHETPLSTGELYGINADGSGKGLLVGQRVQGPATGTRINNGKKEEMVAAIPLGTVPGDSQNVLLQVWSFQAKDPFGRVDRMDVNTGRRTTIAKSPVANADFVLDNKGQVRFASGHAGDNLSQLYYRDDDNGDWRLINRESESNPAQYPLGFSADDKVAYLRVRNKQGTDSVIGIEVASGKTVLTLQDPVQDPQIVWRDDCGLCNVPIGVHFGGAAPRTVFFDENSAQARLQHGLEKAFAGNRIFITSATRDARYKLVETDSDIDPGSIYLFDTQKKNADFVMARGKDIDPEKMAKMQAFELKARDGVQLHGFLTVPKGSDGTHLPLVVYPHGGPFDIRDEWGYDTDVQLLAASGYAVLQLNYRGSGGYGYVFEKLGAQQWGGTMQDDLTDATHWAIDQSIADANRICIYGASYGAYAALEGVAKEPGLYKCAVGYVGVYDLPKVRNESSFGSRSGRTWRSDWIGNDAAQLDAASPNRHADRIKVPVFLAAGRADFVAPVEHTEKMETALRQAGVPVETLYYPKEGHGFYDVEHRREFYTRLLDFLDRNIGDGTVANQP